MGAPTDTAADDAGGPLPRSTPRAQGVAAAGVAAFLDALDAAPQIEPHSLVLVRHGHVVAEGWWAPYAPDGVALLYSLSKSFTSSALGLAVAEGLVSLDDTVLSHFPELDADVTDPRSRRMLVRHVAAMASGHATEALDRALATDPDDLVRGFLLTPPDAEPGTLFAYNQPCTYTVAAIVARRSGQTLTDYLRPRLLDPLGIGDVAWERDASGRDLGYSGLHATTDAVARLGLLHLRRGEWGGRRLLPPEWVDAATSVQVHNAEPYTSPDWVRGYGFQFWQSRHGYRGDGAYGQLCVVLPEHDAVLAMTAATEDLQGLLDAVWTHVVPALGEPVPDDAAAAADDALAARLAALALDVVPGAPEPPSDAAWDGFDGAAAAGPLAGVRVDRRDGSWRAILLGRHPADADAPLEVPLGGPGWVTARCALPAGVAVPDAATDAVPDAVPVAVTGGWDEAGALAFDVLFVQTPHRLRVRCEPPGGGARGGDARGSVTAQWVTEPLGAPPLRRLRAPFA